LCEGILKKYKILFVLNKGDTVEKKTVSKLAELIEKEEIENCAGIFTTMANTSNYSPNLDHCPNCNSENISSIVKEKKLICDDCEWSDSWSKFAPKSDIIPLINKTKDLLPQQQQVGIFYLIF
jgi:hypothetical protein